MAWQHTIITLSDQFFPGIYENSCNGNKKIGYEVFANLPLQMSLYFNVVFFPFWLITIINIIDIKYRCLPPIYQFILVTVLLAAVLLEVLRLYLGYSGNLNEKIPDLAGFWMLSALLQFPLQLFILFNYRFKPHVIELVAQTVIVLLLSVQLIYGYWTLRSVTKHQAMQFRLQQFNIDNVKNKKRI